jgi:archaellum component FlaF (FlaF/FlaG flagellin family)
MKNNFDMKKIIYSILMLFAAGSNLYAQKTTYNIPKPINTDQLSVSFQKVAVSSTSYYVNFKAVNNGNGILLIDRAQINLEQNNGQINANSDKYHLKTGKNKTVYCQFRIKAPVKTNAEKLTLNMDGFGYAQTEKTIKAEEFVLAEKASTTFGDFAFKIMEYNTYPDRIYANVKCTYNGNASTLGKIDLSKINVKGGKAEIVKKGDIILPGKSYSFSINIAPNGEETAIVFNDALELMHINKVQLEPIVITSTNYVEPAKTEDKEVAKKAEAKANTVPAELSYTDLHALKKDIETEMKNGGKAVEMAHEFLMEKQHISTAQVIDLMSVFSLDGSKLKFAKMAYPFTSDKQKFHLVVPKLSYVKNKQALEEFLEQQ